MKYRYDMVRITQVIFHMFALIGQIRQQLVFNCCLRMIDIYRTQNKCIYNNLNLLIRVMHVCYNEQFHCWYKPWLVAIQRQAMVSTKTELSFKEIP